jgi:hypothetical protein
MFLPLFVAFGALGFIGGLIIFETPSPPSPNVLVGMPDADAPSISPSVPIGLTTTASGVLVNTGITIGSGTTGTVIYMASTGVPYGGIITVDGTTITSNSGNFMEHAIPPHGTDYDVMSDSYYDMDGNSVADGHANGARYHVISEGYYGAGGALLERRVSMHIVDPLYCSPGHDRPMVASGNDPVPGPVYQQMQGNAQFASVEPSF